MAKLISLIALIMGLILYFGFSWGYIFYRYWYWFVLDVFPELPNIAYYQAIGLMVFLGLFKNNLPKRDFKEDLYSQTKVSQTVMAVVFPWITLFSGWLIYIFITY